MRWKSEINSTRNIIHTLDIPQGTVSIVQWTDDKASLVDLHARKKGCGHGTYLVKQALQKARRLKLENLFVLPEETEEAQTFWNKMGIGPSGGQIS